MSTIMKLAEFLTAALVLAGSGAALIGSIGLLRMPTFYDRVHPPTIGATAGLGLVLAASMLFFSVLQGRLVVHEIMIGVFMLVTTPVTYIVLVQAALSRDEAAPGSASDGFS